MKIWSTLILTIIIATSCSTLDKSRMLRTPTNYKFETFSDSVNYKEPYKIAVDDEIRIQMFSNDGYNFINLSGGGQLGGMGSGQQGRGQQGMGGQGGLFYKVRADSTIKVPLVGKVNVVGLTLDELENKFESMLVNQFNSPFVIAQINNRRVFVFQGGNEASIFLLQNENTTLFEVLAQVGGVSEEGNAARIKLIRGSLKDPEIFLINLSTIDGMKEANLNMQAGDIVYVDPFLNYAQRISNDIGSIVGLVSAVLLVYTVTQR